MQETREQTAARSEQLRSIKPGMIVAYRLLPKDMPVNPLKVWRGKVMQYNGLSIRVETLEPGYEGLTEIISYEQVIGVS